MEEDKLNNAINSLKKSISIYDANYCLATSQALKTVLNELKRLQKENEDWQKAYQEEKDEQFNMLINNKCLHCNENTPLYCEKCHQELITKNAELQLEIEQEKQYYIKKCGDCTELSFKLDNCIPKQVLRDKIEELETKLKEFSLSEYCLYEDSIQAKIKIYKELLGEVNK